MADGAKTQRQAHPAHINGTSSARRPSWLRQAPSQAIATACSGQAGGHEPGREPDPVVEGAGDGARR